MHKAEPTGPFPEMVSSKFISSRLWAQEASLPGFLGGVCGGGCKPRFITQCANQEFPGNKCDLEKVLPGEGTCMLAKRSQDRYVIAQEVSA